jgi:hypothetical protein
MTSSAIEEERHLFEYFIVAGLNNTDEAEELVPLTHECGNKVADQLAPITDICVIFPGLGETVSPFTMISHIILDPKRL